MAACLHGNTPVLRLTSHISTGYPIYHFRGREPINTIGAGAPCRRRADGLLDQACNSLRADLRKQGTVAYHRLRVASHVNDRARTVPGRW
jgi:hypothetical protein